LKIEEENKCRGCRQPVRRRLALNLRTSSEAKKGKNAEIFRTKKKKKGKRKKKKKKKKKKWALEGY